MCYWLRLKFTIRCLLVVIIYLWLAKYGISRHFGLFICGNSRVSYQFDVRNYHTYDSLVWLILYIIKHCDTVN